MKNFIFCAVKIINTKSSLSRPEVFFKKAFLESSQNSKENTSAGASLLIKGLLTQMFSCEFYEIFKSNFFHRTPPVAASILCQNSFLFCFTIFSERIFSNCLKHLKRFCCECEHTLL